MATLLPNPATARLTLRFASISPLAILQIPASPPLVNNTNTETETGFVLVFYNDYFGIKVETNVQKKQKNS